MMKSHKHQIIIIKGGSVFKNKNDYYNYLRTKKLDLYQTRPSWKKWLTKKLNKNFESFILGMPNSRFADYKSWQIWFEKYLEFLNPNPMSKLTMIGHSLGGTFLIKYISEHQIPKQIHQLHLVATPIVEFKNSTNEILGNFKPNLYKLKLINNQVNNTYLYHSQDDLVAPFSHAQILLKKLEYGNLKVFTDRGHFKQKTFPELLSNILKQ